MEKPVKLDLHLHSVHSDGSMTPAELAAEAEKAGARLVSLTDHDSIAGVREMARECEAHGIRALPGVELECMISVNVEAHILVYNFNPDSSALIGHLKLISKRRGERNGRILDRLQKLKLDVENALPHSHLEALARTHIAYALVLKGYAGDMNAAFRTYLGQSGSAYFCHERPEAAELLDIIKRSGGVSVLAHPHKLRMDVHEAIRQLSERGLYGVEAYYPTHSNGQIRALKQLAKRYGLAISCGSDFHGAYRKGVEIACCFQEDEELRVWE